MSRSPRAGGCLPIVAIFVIVFALMFLVVWNSPAKSQGFSIPVFLKCNTTKFISDMLKYEYQEESIGLGSSAGEKVQLYTSHGIGNNETWTLVISNPNGYSCIIKGGSNWIVAPLIPKGKPT